MFTGTVKLAQIDDYINPSQNCIQPKIMKHDLKPEVATVSLNDCLACSGCITSAQSVLIEQMSVNKLLQLIKLDPSRPLVVILAPQVIISLAIKFQKRVQIIFVVLQKFFKEKLRAQLVLDLWQGIELAHQLGYQEYLQRKQKTLLCSECPGWICYAQKTLTDQVVRLLSQVKSPQQVLGRMIKSKMPNSLVLTVMPCYDKKLQAIRFDIESGIKEVDITITSTQMLDLYSQMEDKQIGQVALEVPEVLKVDRIMYSSVPFGFVADQITNGHVEALLSRLGATIIKRTQVKNGDFLDIQAQLNGQTIRMAKCYGFRNIQKIVQQIKKNKCQYRYIEIMACPGGCYSGGGQVKLQNYKPKEITSKCNQVSSESTLKDHQQGYNQILSGRQKQFQASYKVIQKTLTQAVMNW